MTIRYNHTSAQTADSYESALALVRTQAIHTQRRASAAHELVAIDVDDGTYIYLSQADADRDQTGERAFAVISAE